ncbi:hypothetical protein JMJ77_0004034, partial [Colletotrichum scovillei]
ENRQWASTRRTRRPLAPWTISLSILLRGISADEAKLKRLCNLNETPLDKTTGVCTNIHRSFVEGGQQ